MIKKYWIALFALILLSSCGKTSFMQSDLEGLEKTEAAGPLSQWTTIDSIADGDFVPLTDISDTTDSANGTSKKATGTQLKTYIDIGFISESEMTAHEGAVDPHTVYVLESAAGSAHTRNAEDSLTDGGNLPDGAAIIAYLGTNYHPLWDYDYNDLVNNPTIPSESSLGVDDLKTLSGVAGGSTNLGTFTGTTISDNGTVKAGMQELETDVELNNTNLATHAGAADPHSGYMLESNIGTGANNYVQLNASGDLPFAIGVDTSSFGGEFANTTAYDTMQELFDYIDDNWPTASSVTYETLDTAGDVGTGAGQLAIGNHNHSGTYEPADATIIKQVDVDDTPDNGDTTTPPSANWAYDHENDADAHRTEAQLEALLELQDLNGAVTDSQVPNDITITGMTSEIASGTVTVNPGSISDGACATVVTDTATGAATTDVISWSFDADPTSTTGYDPSGDLVYIVDYPTTNTANFKVCNKSGSAVDPGAVDLNWRIDR